MSPLEILDRATAEFDHRVRTVGPDRWPDSAGMGDWTVRDLIDHVIGGNRMAVVLLAGGSSEEAIAAFALSRDDTDLAAAYEDTARKQAEAFAAPGALDGIVHHPMGDMPAAQLIDFRIMDLAVHAWDLARATGGDESLDETTVQHIWDQLQPIAPIMGHIGVFGEGASGTVPEDAPLQLRMLDLSGRRP